MENRKRKMNLPQRIIQNLAKLMSGYAISRAIWFFFIIFLARRLGPDEFGVFSFAVAFVNFFVLFTDLGINQLSIRELSRNRSEIVSHFQNVFLLKLFLSGLVCILVALSIQVLNKSEAIVSAVYFASLLTIFNSLTNFLRSYFRALELFSYEAYSMILERVFLVGFGLPALLFTNNLVLVLKALALGSLLTFITVLLIIRLKQIVRLDIRIKGTYLKNLLKKAAPFAVMDLFIWMYFRVDMIMLSLMRDETAVGIYSSAFRLLEVLTLVPILTMRVVYPVMSQLFLTDINHLQTVVRQLMRFFLLFSIPLAIGVTFWSNSIVELIYGSNYMDAAVALKILIYTLPFISMTYVLGTLLAATDNQLYSTINTGICAAFNILLNLILIPEYSYVGAAVATVLSEALLVTLCAISARKVPIKLVKPIILLKIMAVNLTFALLLFVMKLANFAFPAAVLLSVPILVLLHVWSGLSGKKDLVVILKSLSIRV